MNSFIRVCSAMPEIKVCDVRFNLTEIQNITNSALLNNSSIVVFPELCLTGYTCSDLFFQQQLIDEALEALIELKHFSKSKEIVMIVGFPLLVSGALYNCAGFLLNGQILGIVPKTHIPNYNEFYEHRWFASARNLIDEEVLIDGEYIPLGTDLIFANNQLKSLKIGIEICEDLWTPIPPSSFLTLQGATLIANLSASNEVVGKINYRKKLIASQSSRSLCSYIYSSSGFGESSTDLVFGGHLLVYENGILIAENKRFQLTSNFITADIDLERLISDRMKLTTYRDSAHAIQKCSCREIFFNLPKKEFMLNRFIDPHPFVPSAKAMRDERCHEIFDIQTLGLVKRLKHIGCEKVVIGISGGLDSTLAFLVCSKAYELLGLNKKNIIGVTMPGFGTSDRTYQNALILIESIGATLKEIPIRDACELHFKDIDHDIKIHDVTYENAQARERTQILMDLANQENGIVIGTGDLSELAQGFATYNGDHMSMYAVNVSIPKTLVRYLVAWVSHNATNTKMTEVLEDILATPVSPELLPPDANGEINQKTEELIGPYELHDFFLYYIVRFGFSPKKVFQLAVHAFQGTYDQQTILSWLKSFYKRFFAQQFKRSCMPDGPKVGSICLSPRGDWRMPSDASCKVFLEELDKI